MKHDDDMLKNMNLDDSITDENPHDADHAEDAANSDHNDSLEHSLNEALNATPEVSSDKENGAKPDEEQSPQKAETSNNDQYVWGVDAQQKPRFQKRSARDREFSMMLKMRGRALSEALMSIAGTRQRSGRLWLTFFATFIVITLLIIQVYYRHRELNLGYELSAAISQRELLLEENRKLRIELRVLSRRERLEPMADRQLGMVTIRPDQVLIVNTNQLKKKTATGRRQDGLDNVKRIGEE